jgi:signal recognition particle subunit SRP54
MTLIENAQEAISEEDTEDMAQRMMSGNITLDDFLSQMQSMKKMGGLQKVLNMLPGVRITQEVDDSALKVPEAIIRSMTMKERRNPGILNASRRRRIAAGSGTSVQQVNQLIRQFDQAKQMMKQMQGPGARRKLAAMMRNSK